MLLNLRIHNFAIIDTVDIELHAGFTVLTGETGAGKSILIDALMVALGSKASINLVRSGAQTAEVEALFDIRTQPLIQQRLAERHLTGDSPEHLLIRRVIGPRKRGKILVNGHLTTVATLVALVQGLVDISGQHEQQSLLAQDNHVGILDAYGAHQDILTRYQQAYQHWMLLRREKNEQEKALAENLNREDFLRFQWQEIADLDPKPEELTTLADACARLAHAEKLQHVAANAELQLYGGDHSAFDQLSVVGAELQTLAGIDQGLAKCVEQLCEARGHIEDVANQLRRYVDRIEVDPHKLETLQSRYDALLRLARKHGGDLTQVLEKQCTLQTELAELQASTTRMQTLDQDIALAWQQVVAQSQALTAARHLAGQALDQAIVTEAADMELEDAVFQTRIQSMSTASQTYACGPLGAETIQFLWSANPGESPKPLTKIISGGGAFAFDARHEARLVPPGSGLGLRI